MRYRTIKTIYITVTSKVKNELKKEHNNEP